MTDFLLDLGNNGWLQAAPAVGTCTTHTNTTLDTFGAGISTVTCPKGALIKLGSAGHAPDIVAASASAASSLTILTATSASTAGVALTVFQNPVLVGGEASGLTNGSAVLSSYWTNPLGANTAGVFDPSVDFLSAPDADIFFISGGAFTPTAGGFIYGWFIPSYDGGTTFESDAIATASSTVSAEPRSPDFTIALDAAAHAAGSTRWMQARTLNNASIQLPSQRFKVKLQNLSGATMPSTWAVVAGSRAIKWQ